MLGRGGVGLKEVTSAVLGDVIPRDSVHAVQFYETDRFLIDRLTAYVRRALRAGEAAIVIATDGHLAALKAALTEQGVDVATTEQRSQLTCLDARATLAHIAPPEGLDREQFDAVIGGTVARAREDSPSLPVRAFGEMLALLWADGRAEVALDLEDAWRDLIHRTNIALICAYPVSVFSDADRMSGVIAYIRGAHTPLHRVL